MQYLGETISLAVAVSWTVTAMVAEVASKRIGPQVLNVWRMVISLVLLGATLWFVTGNALPSYADSTTWLWLLASGAVGYVFGDFCLFNSYVYMGSRWGQLFMMLAPIAASFTAWMMLGETLTLQVVCGIVVTLTGISMSVVGKNKKTQTPSPALKTPSPALKTPSPALPLYGEGEAPHDASLCTSNSAGSPHRGGDGRRPEGVCNSSHRGGDAHRAEGVCNSPHRGGDGRRPEGVCGDGRRAEGVSGVLFSFSLKIPVKGVLFGIGAGVGQGVGLVLSKVGMEHYEQCIPVGADGVGDMMPFASTMIRACAGLVGLLLIMILKGDAPRLPRALKDGKGMLCTFVASVTGPFIGVSLSLMALLYTSAGVAQTLMSLTPILILWPSKVFFHQRITAIEVVGAVVSMVGVSLFFL